jgi:hypothetical protein
MWLALIAEEDSCAFRNNDLSMDVTYAGREKGSFLTGEFSPSNPGLIHW